MKKHILLAGWLACGLMLFTACGQQGDMDKQSGEANQSPIVVTDAAKPIGLYAKVLDDLYQEDVGLNSDIEMVAFDFSRCGNLTAEEKESLMKYLADKWGISYRESNLEQLKADGYILIDDNGFTHFDKGILVSIETAGTVQEAENKESFTFTAEKYRTSLGAYLFSDCTATFNGKEWQYEIGAQMIS